MTIEGWISEDERYRTSSQYRLWSFTPEALYDLRRTTNQIAADRVRQAVRCARENYDHSKDITETDRHSKNPLSEGEVDCLTVEEELKLVVFYCRQTIQLGDHLGLPSDVKATAIQFMKRFYITNSLMTYHPTDILKTALFFATKTENFYFRLTKFADAIGKTKPEDVLASEFLLTQGLRFTFDVRHPYRALEGAVMELQALSKAFIPVLPNFTEAIKDRPSNMERRVKDAHRKAREYLKSSTLLTDVYFFFTPSQIMMAALMNADGEIVKWWIQQKFPPIDTEDIQEKILSTVQSCADMLKTVDPGADPSPEERKELQSLAKKLKKCRNPDKIDLVALQRAKREGDATDFEKVAKKRKLDRENSINKADDIFGPAINLS